MKRLLIVTCVVFAALVAAPAWAQPDQTNGRVGPAKSYDAYVVQKDDTLYELAGLYLGDKLAWGQVLGANPFLNQPGRVFDKDGKTIVIIRPGETLAGLTDLGIEPKVVPFSEIKAEDVNQATYSSSWLVWFANSWLAWAISLIAALIIGYFAVRELRRREREERDLAQDPVRSGPPIVAGGVESTDTARLTQSLEAAAVSDYVRLNPGVDRNSVRVERVGPIEQGMISGEGMVGYADRARPRRINPAQPGYRARFRFPDGREDNLMSLQGCMNPCYYGEGLSGFTFEPTSAVVPAPDPPAPAPQPVPHPALAARAIRTAAESEGQTTVTIGDRVLVFERGVHLNVDEATGAITVNGTSFEMTVQPKRARSRKPASVPRAVGDGK